MAHNLVLLHDYNIKYYNSLYDADNQYEWTVIYII